MTATGWYQKSTKKLQKTALMEKKVSKSAADRAITKNSFTLNLISIWLVKNVPQDNEHEIFSMQTKKTRLKRLSVLKAAKRMTNF